jgi:hypothetical protein
MVWTPNEVADLITACRDSKNYYMYGGTKTVNWRVVANILGTGRSVSSYRKRWNDIKDLDDPTLSPMEVAKMSNVELMPWSQMPPSVQNPIRETAKLIARTSGDATWGSLPKDAKDDSSDRIEAAFVAANIRFPKSNKMSYFSNLICNQVQNLRYQEKLTQRTIAAVIDTLGPNAINTPEQVESIVQDIIESEKAGALFDLFKTNQDASIYIGITKRSTEVEWRENMKQNVLQWPDGRTITDDEFTNELEFVVSEKVHKEALLMNIRNVEVSVLLLFHSFSS